MKIEKEEKNDKNDKNNKKAIIVITAILFVILVISAIKIIMWKNDANNIEKQIKTINDNISIYETEDTTNTEIISQPEKTEEKSNPYWDYIKISLINVDFSKLKSINKEVKGWIQVSGTNINYPFVQTNDNKYYLTHSFDKSYNQAGWVFLDYRNDINKLDKNTIIYAHSRSDSTMFGTLKNIINRNWYNNSNNYVIKLSTESQNTLWQVFSVYHIETTSDYIQVSFDDNDEYLSFLDKLKNRSVFDFKTKLSANDKILTLSSCYSKTEKIVMHAKLIKKESR